MEVVGRVMACIVVIAPWVDMEPQKSSRCIHNLCTDFCMSKKTKLAHPTQHAVVIFFLNFKNKESSTFPNPLSPVS